MSTSQPVAPAPARRIWPKRVLKVGFFLALTLISILIVFEIGFRIFYRLIPLGVCASSSIVGNYYCQPYLVYDKPIDIAYRYQPGYKTAGWWNPADPHDANPGDETRPTGRNDTFWYTFQTDEMGFPNDEYTWRDQYDVVIAGDSFTLRSAPKTWIELLRQQTGLSVLTLGAPSWGPLNEVEAIKQYGLDKHPKWVLVMYFEGNDLYGTGQYLERQPTGLSWEEFDFRNTPITQQLVMPYMIQYLFDQLRGNLDSSAHPYRYPVTASTEAGSIQMVLKDFQLLPMSAGYNTLAHSDEFMATKAKLLELKQEISIGSAQTTLLFGEYALDRDNPVFRAFAEALFKKGIAAVTVAAGITADEMLRFLSCLSAGETVRGGALSQGKLFSSPHITLTWIDFGKFGFDETQESDEAESLPLWENYISAIMGGALSSDQSETFVMTGRPADIARILNGKIEWSGQHRSYDRISSA